MADKPEKTAKPEKQQKKGGHPEEARAKQAKKGGDAKQAADGQRAAAEAVAREPEPRIPARLRVQFEKEIAVSLMRELKIENRMRVPRLEKITINMALNEARENVKILDAAVDELGLIAGQKPVMTRSRKAISNFKIREGMPLGVVVTLRRERMWEFFDRLVNVALPRVRDFRGVSEKSFDGRGNYSLGVREHSIFAELNLDKVEKIKGLTITIGTTARSDFEGLTLLRALGLPFRGASGDRVPQEAAAGVAQG
jgi:large subunit ribosomal protein L5